MYLKNFNVYQVPSKVKSNYFCCWGGKKINVTLLICNRIGEVFLVWRRHLPRQMCLWRRYHSINFLEGHWNVAANYNETVPQRVPVWNGSWVDNLFIMGFWSGRLWCSIIKNIIACPIYLIVLFTLKICFPLPPKTISGVIRPREVRLFFLFQTLKLWYKLPWWRLMLWSLNMIDCLSGWPNVYTIMLSSSVIEWSAVLQGGFSNALNKAFLDRKMHNVPPSTFSYTPYVAFWKIKLCWICSSCTKVASLLTVMYSFYWMFWPLFFLMVIQFETVWYPHWQPMAPL